MRESLELYKVKNTIKVEVKSIPEFQELLEQAEKEANQLRNTLSRLREYTIDFHFGVEGETISSL